MIVRCVQMDIVGDPARNIAHAIELAQSRPLDAVDVLLFPEMFSTGFQVERIHELAHAPGDPLFGTFQDLARRAGVNIVLGSLACRTGGDVRNTTFVIDRQGRIVSSYAKCHLFALMGEPQYVRAGDAVHHFELDGVRMSSIICYDLRFPELTRKLFVDRSPVVVFVPMSWPAPRTNVFRTLVRARAIENQCFVVSANRVGTENGSQFEGYSTAADPFGNVVGELPNTEGLLDVQLDLALVEKARTHMDCLGDRRPDLY
ncbi:MAG: carbon-nitrogen family hydrolase [Candidatus Hydrogenedentes bacterium]|nr:carbon-nitrogen family hydrolase [Candidatus Hydrogenedentota bacterium]